MIFLIRLGSLVLFFLVGVSWGESGKALDYVPGEVIVRYKGSGGAHSLPTLGKAAAQTLILKKSWNRLNMQHFQIKPGSGGVGAKIDQLLQDPNVLYAEPNYILKKASIAEPRTEIYTMAQIGEVVRSQSTTYGMTGASIQAVEAWDVLSASGNDPIVAIIDTGVDYNHSVFVESGAIWSNPGEIPNNGIDDDANGYVDDIVGWNFAYNNNAPLDDDGHGTHVAGTVLGVGLDIFASPLEQAKIKIMPLKFLDNQGSGTTASAIQAIYYAVDQGARVINNSWGGGAYSTALHEAIAYTYEANVVFVAASGNAGTNNDKYPMYPASYDVPNVLAIAASTDSDGLAYFSNYGASSVDIGSPGVSILSTFPSDTFGYSSGTSMATPFVSGVAALMLRESDSMSAFQVKEIILDQSEVSSGLKNKVATGSRLHVLHSIMVAQGATILHGGPDYSISLSGQDRELASSFATNGGGGCGIVSEMGDSGQGPWRTGVLFCLIFLAPLVVLMLYRRSTRSEADQRRHQRYKIDTSVRVNVGGRELIGSVSSISLGGLQLNTDALLEDGGIISMSIFSPSGKEQVQIEGRVVWSEEKKAYGVEFATDGKAKMLQRIGQWTSALSRA